MRHLYPVTLILLLAMHSAVADIIFLKDGSQLKGEIVEEGLSGVTVEYLATPTIKDQKSIAKADIEKIEKVSPDQKAFQEIGSLETPATVVDVSFYDPLIDRKLPDFLAKYSDSAYATQLKERLETLTQERNRVRQGDRRIDGTWITADQISSDPYQKGALLKFSEMKQQAERKNHVESLRRYEILEKKFAGSEVMPDGIDLALKQLDRLEADLSVSMANFAINDKNRENAIAATTADQAKIIKEGVEKEKAEATAAIAAASADGGKFFPVFPNSKEALESLQVLITSERSRLLQLKKVPMREGLVASRECARLIALGKTKEAQEQLALSQKFWPANIENSKLKEQVDKGSQSIFKSITKP